MIKCDDLLVPVGHEAKITARFTLKGVFRLHLRPQGKPIRFHIEGQTIGEVETGPHGSASLLYTPREEKDYRVTATYTPLRSSRPAIAEAILFSRSTAKQVIVLDMDHTLFASSRLAAVFRRNRNLPSVRDAVAVTHALARKYDLIIVTGRRSYVRGKTRQWLAEKGFPAAPIFFSPASRPFLWHERFKVEVIRELKRTWPNIAIGIGDKDSDARVYLANGLRPIILRQAGPRPPNATVAPDWQSIHTLLP